MASFYGELLANYGAPTLCFSANQAIELLDNHEFDVILSDYLMDDGDGIHLAKYLYDKKSLTPLILLTGFATKDIAIESVKYGVYAFLEKRCTPTEIIDVVRNGIEYGKIKKRQSNFSQMGEITSILMHEVIDPLNRSLSRLELLSSQKNQSSWEDNVNNIKEDLEYLSRLISNVRLQIKGQKEVYLKRYTLRQFLEVIETLQESIQLQIDPSIDAHLSIRSDVILFNQVLENLRKNSIEAMAKESDEPASMQLKVMVNDDRVIFEFINNTPEISEKIRTRIFEPFISSKKNDSDNLGIGLYFCSQTLKAHGGDIYVKEGLPTTFVMSVPVFK